MTAAISLTRMIRLLFDRIPEEMVIAGGGYEAITMGSLMAAMGTRLTMIHKGEKLLPFLDDDIMQPVMETFKNKGVRVISKASWTASVSGDKVKIDIDSEDKKETIETNKLLVAAGNVGNTDRLGLENTKVKTDKNGLVIADDSFRTDDPSIYVIGDVKCGHCNASKAFREGASLAEILAGRTGFPEYTVMPYTVSSNPEIASAGMSEHEAKNGGIDVIVARSPFSANGKAVSIGKTEGFVKVVAEKIHAPHPWLPYRGPPRVRHHRRSIARHRDGRKAGRCLIDDTPASGALRGTAGSMRHGTGDVCQQYRKVTLIIW